MDVSKLMPREYVDPTSDDGADRLLRGLEAYPEDVDLEWDDDGIDSLFPYTPEMVEVRQPLTERAMDLAYCWRVTMGARDVDNDTPEIVLEPDCAARIHISPKGRVIEAAVVRDEEVIQEIPGWAVYPLVWNAEFVDGVAMVPLLSVEAISEGVTDWILGHTGRFDIDVSYAPRLRPGMAPCLSERMWNMCLNHFRDVVLYEREALGYAAIGMVDGVKDLNMSAAAMMTRTDLRLSEIGIGGVAATAVRNDLRRAAYSELS